MHNPVKAILERRQERRRERSTRALDALKVRYHTFRILLDNNETCLDLIHSLEQSLRSPGVSRENLSEDIEELLDVSYELVDGLNHLNSDRHSALYDKHRHIAEAIRRTLDSLVTRPFHTRRCISLSDVTRNQEDLAGGKATPLGFLSNAGFPVPDGFVVTVEACREVLSANGIDLYMKRRLQRLENGDIHAIELEAEARDIRSRILAASLPEGLLDELIPAYEHLKAGGYPSVSVRSSALVEDKADHSFAGQFRSVLNVRTPDALKVALKEVISGNYSARAINYRLHAALPLESHDMAVLCQRMVFARTAGGLFTVDPAAPHSGRMLLSAIPGLGTLVVDGSAPTDLYRPLRDSPNREPMHEWAQIAVKTHRAVILDDGGIGREAIVDEERSIPALSSDEALALVRYGRMIESLMGSPQDIEWAISHEGEIFILQSRNIRLGATDRHVLGKLRGKALLTGGVVASPGRSVGKVKVIRSAQDVESWRKTDGPPGIMVLHQSLPDAAGWMSQFEGVIVDLGNPADHLSCVAREQSQPMLTGTGKATEVLRDGDWVVLDADSTTVLQAPADVWATSRRLHKRLEKKGNDGPPFGGINTPEAAKLSELVASLNLTDAYGPTFSIRECRSLHDLVRYSHEKAVLAMFDAGDDFLKEAEMLVHRLDEGVPCHFLVIDLGGGISPGGNGFRVRCGDILSRPLLALLKGITTPALQRNHPLPVASLSGLFSRSMLDPGSARPLGNQNYALITRDYLNLNARVDYHFTMVDAVCCAGPRENYIRFRFKGGGTAAVQRERRARFVTAVLDKYQFFTDQRGDLVNAWIAETRKEEIEERLEMIGKLVGFSRLLDATMRDDSMPQKVAGAFLEGDYGLRSIREEPAGL